MSNHNQKYRVFFEKAPEAIVILSLDTWRFVEVNDRALALFKLDRPALLRCGPIEISPERQPGGRRSEELARELLERATRGEKVSTRWTHIDGDGRPVPCRIILQRLPAEGSAVLISGIIVDIREELAAERALQESRDAFRALVEACFQGIALSVDGRIIEGNDALARMFGYEPEELAGLTVRDLATPESQEVVLQNIRLGREQSYRAVGRRRDGSTFPVEIIGRNTCYQGAPARVSGVRDLTEELRSAEERQRLEAQVQYAQKLKSLGVLAGGIAHDFNNLLQGIIGNVELARLALSKGEPVDRYIERIGRTARRSAELTDQLLSYAGRGQFSSEDIALNEIIQEMAELLEVNLPKEVSLRLELAPELPAVRADAAQLRQVLLNLITNAAEAIGNRPGEVFIRTSARQITSADLADMVLSSSIAPGRYVELWVTDNGEGMDELTLSRLYDPFFTTKFTGRGLGLASVQGIVKGHGGAIEVASTRGQGTTFRVLLPASDAPRVRPDGSAGEALERAVTVLVADDEPMILEILRTLLERAGLEVLTAADGRAAVALYRQHGERIDLVILDMTMPVLSGAETLAVLREIDPAVRVMISSGNPERDVEAITHQDVQGFIHKPFTSAQLLSAVQAVLAEG